MPPVSLLALVLVWGRHPGVVGLSVVAVVLAAAVLAAVHHAEVVAHRVGEPYGSLVLAVAVTVIEVALILTLMVSGGKDTSVLARDTVFAAVMITCNGIVGLCLLTGAIRFGTTHFNAEGTGAALATVVTLATTCLVLPNFTTTTPGPEFSGSQLAFVAIASLTLYLMFVVTQTVRHRDFFLPVTSEGDLLEEDEHAARPSDRRALISLGLLLDLAGGRRRAGQGRVLAHRGRRGLARPPQASSASSSPCWCCCPSRSPRSTPPAVVAPRSASTSRWGPPWPASG